MNHTLRLLRIGRVVPLPVQETRGRERLTVKSSGAGWVCPSGPTCGATWTSLRGICSPSLSQVDLSRLRTWLSLSPSSELGRGGYNVGTVGGRETSSTGGGRGGESASSPVPSSCSGGPLRVPQYGGGGGSPSSSGS